MDLQRLFQHLLELPDGLLYASLFVAALLENLLPPVPGDTVVVFGGYLAGVGRLTLPGTFAAVTLGSWCGFMVYYGLGRWLGRTRVHVLLARWVTPESLLRGEQWVRRYGYRVVLANRLLTGARSVISLSAGFVGLRVERVGVLALASSALWNVLLVGGGYWIGEEWQRIVTAMHAYNRIVAIAVLALAGFVAYRWWRARRQARRP